VGNCASAEIEENTAFQRVSPGEKRRDANDKHSELLSDQERNVKHSVWKESN
jgi:hypothetical protein